MHPNRELVGSLRQVPERCRSNVYPADDIPSSEWIVVSLAFNISYYLKAAQDKKSIRGA
jgi:hypothetical protein